MSTFEPELGQMAFGQPWKQFAVPEIWKAALSFLASELERVSNNQGEGTLPFGNTGDVFVSSIFEVHAYSWGDDVQPFNFKWRDVRISWYKYLGRGMSSNVILDPALAQEMLVDCIGHLNSIDDEAA